MSKQKVGTKEFAAAVVERMGQKPEKLKAVSYAGRRFEAQRVEPKPRAPVRRSQTGRRRPLYGFEAVTPQALGEDAEEITHEGLTLK